MKRLARIEDGVVVNVIVAEDHCTRFLGDGYVDVTPEAADAPMVSVGWSLVDGVFKPPPPPPPPIGVEHKGGPFTADEQKR